MENKELWLSEFNIETLPTYELQLLAVIDIKAIVADLKAVIYN